MKHDELAPLFGRSDSRITKVAKYGWKIVDEPGVLMTLNKTTLRIDNSYQRDLARQRVRDIQQRWSWIACGVVIVAERDQEFYVIDGQHRVAAALSRSDIVDLPCLVFRTDTAQAEARGFVDINLRRKVPSMVAQLKARLVAGDPLARDLVDAVKSCGYEFSTQHPRGAVIKCVGAALREMEASPERFRLLWPLLCDIHAGTPIKERVFGGLFWIERYADGSLTEPKWRKRLSAIGAEKLDAICQRASMLLSKGGPAVWGTALLTEINKGMRLKLQTKSDAKPTEAA